MMDNIKITQVQTGCGNQSQIIRCYVDKINGLKCEKCYMDEGGIVKCVKIKPNKEIKNRDNKGNTQTITFN